MTGSTIVRGRFDKKPIATYPVRLLCLANLQGAKLSCAKLPNERLVGVNLSNADLSDADLMCANMHGVNLSSANLSNADLRGANLNFADLSGAILKGAHLNGASLAGAKLSGAQLAGTDFIGAYLQNANFSGAIIDGLLLQGARPFLQIGPIGSEQEMLKVWVTNKGVRLETDYFFGTKEDFMLTFSKENIHAQEYAAAFNLIDTHAKMWP